jgi:type IV pilus assembly protein PilA
MTLSWYYADGQRQQQGPVADSWLRNAYERGELAATTLVWREGMAQWLPLSQVAHELGITVASAPPPRMPENYRPKAAAAPAKSGASGCLIVGIVLVAGFVVFGGILAAIAIPAYQDYVTRTRVMQAMFVGTALKGDVTSFHFDSGRCPVNGDSGFGTPTSYATNEVASVNIGSLDNGNCAVQVVLKNLGNSATEGKELLFVMDSEHNWTESSTLPQRVLPASMRD